MRKITFILAVFISALCAARCLADARIVFLNLGQADATLILCDGETAVVDTGLAKQEPLIKDALKTYGVTAIKYLVATHPHADNIGNIPYILDNHEVGTLIMPPVSHDTKAYAKMAAAVASSQVKTQNPYAGDVFELGKATVTVYSPREGKYSDPNDWSIVLRLEYAGRSALLCADGEAAREADMLEAAGELPLKSDILRLALHGSKASSSEDFIKAVSPEIAVAACDKEGYPHLEVIKRLNDAGTKRVITTGEAGDIVVDINEQGEIFCP